LSSQNTVENLRRNLPFLDIAALQSPPGYDENKLRFASDRSGPNSTIDEPIKPMKHRRHSNMFEVNKDFNKSNTINEFKKVRVFNQSLDAENEFFMK